MPIVKNLLEDVETIISQIDLLDAHLIEVETEVTAKYLLSDPAALARLQGRLHDWKLVEAKYGLTAPFKVAATFSRKCTHR